MPKQMRLRFAPSPTGPIHVGNAHTMLFNWLWCRNQGGTFVLRFEDTDRERSRPEWEQVVIDEMKWLGLDWDEGPDIGGPYVPYNQMGRLHLYREYFERLRKAEAVYPCYCTPEELAAERAEAERHKTTYLYSRRCLALSAAEKATHEAAGRKPAWRLKVPDGQVLSYTDLIRGQIEFPTHSMSDPIIVRSNGIPTYNFAVVIDDITMDITDVVRGEGHISNTPVQVLVYRALGAAAPRFAHVSHVLNKNRGKIAKRKGEMSVSSYREAGILGPALFNFLALLGWTPADEREIFTRDEAIHEFNIHKVNKAAAVFDEEKLEWMNGVYIRERLSAAELAAVAVPVVTEAGLATAADLRSRWDWFVHLMSQVQPRIRYLNEIPAHVDFFFTDDITYDEKAVQKFLGAAIQPFFRRVASALESVTWTVAGIEAAVRAVMTELALSPKESLQPLRVAVSGRTVSPPLFDTIWLAGRERTLARLGRWL